MLPHTPPLQALLSALVNKLGDPSRKLASDAAFLLGQLLLQHPAMKTVVVREVGTPVMFDGICFTVRLHAKGFEAARGRHGKLVSSCRSGGEGVRTVSFFVQRAFRCLACSAVIRSYIVSRS